MTLLQLLTLSPATGDHSPATRVVVLLILSLATSAAIFFGVWKGKK